MSASVSLIDWKSSRSVRVCRSTLVAEASAGDGVADRSSPDCRLQSVQATDAKSLYDAIVSQNPNMTDKRTLVSVRAIQESVNCDQIYWLPTRFQFADGLTKSDERLRRSFTRWLQHPVAILVDHPRNYMYEELFFEGATRKDPLDSNGNSSPAVTTKKQWAESQKNNTGEESVQ